MMESAVLLSERGAAAFAIRSHAQVLRFPHMLLFWTTDARHVQDEDADSDESSDEDEVAAGKANARAVRPTHRTFHTCVTALS